MTQWQYCELHWQPDGVTVTEFSPDGDHQVQTFDPGELHSAFAQLGADAWELTTSLASPTGIHEYWYYFKRPASS
jgi:hypothetical protein